MKQPEFRIKKVSGMTKDFYYLQERGFIWGWNDIPRQSHYEHSDYEFLSIGDCVTRVKQILRSRKPETIVREFYTNDPFLYETLKNETEKKTYKE